MRCLGIFPCRNLLGQAAPNLPKAPEQAALAAKRCLQVYKMKSRKETDILIGDKGRPGVALKDEKLLLFTSQGLALKLA